MDVGGIITIIVAVIAAGSAYASQRAAARATTINTSTTSRVDMEKEAYERARKFDIETIARQDAEIEELRADNRMLHEKLAVARAEAREARREAREAQIETRSLRERIAVLESGNLNPPNTS
jgi:FtsZ-binding cell division protein ZapB